MLNEKKEIANKLLNNADLDDINTMIEEIEMKINTLTVENTDEMYKKVVDLFGDLSIKIDEIKAKNKEEVEKKIADLKVKIIDEKTKSDFEAQIKECEDLHKERRI